MAEVPVVEERKLDSGFRTSYDSSVNVIASADLVFDGTADQLGEVPADSPKLPFCGRGLRKPPAVVACELRLTRWAGRGQVWLQQAGEVPPGPGWSVGPWALPAQSRGAPRGPAGLTWRARHSHRAWPAAALEYLLVGVKEVGGDGRS